MPTFIHKNLVGADAIHPAAFVQATDPGSVGANLLWIDTSTSPPGLKVRNVGNTAWTVFGSTGPAGATGATGAAGTNGTNGATGTAGPPGTNIVSGAAPYVNIQDQKSSGTNGGTFASGSYLTRDLNTIATNDLALQVTLVANQLTLPAGTYRCHINVAAFGVGSHKLRLQNITDTNTALTGMSAVSANSDNTATTAFLEGRFAIGSAKLFEVQHRCSVTFADTRARGVAASFGDVEVYTVAEFWLEGPPPPFMGTTYLTAGQQQQISRSRPDFQQHSLNTPPQ